MLRSMPESGFSHAPILGESRVTGTVQVGQAIVVVVAGMEHQSKLALALLAVIVIGGRGKYLLLLQVVELAEP